MDLEQCNECAINGFLPLVLRENKTNIVISWMNAKRKQNGTEWE